MMRKYKQSKAKTNLIVYLLVVLIVFSAFTGFVIAGSAKAESTYSDVLTDLQMDENFDTALYPEIEDNYSLQVIQIAESTDDELLVYVYQPSGQALDLRASSIYISTKDYATGKPDYNEYSLTYLNSNGVFYKYKVDDFTLSNDTTRYYDILRIHRPWNNELDGELEGGNTGNYQVYSVAKMFVATEIDGQISYSCVQTDVIEVVSKYVGYLSYFDGGVATDVFYTYSHYFAFDTDKPIDRILSIEVAFETKKASSLYGTVIVSGNAPLEPHDNVIINHEDSSSNPIIGFWGHRFTWPLISSVDEFIEDNDLTNIALDNLKDKQWVVRFFEQTINASVAGFFDFPQNVSMVTIQYEYNGQVYNLGVVDNKQSGDIIPDNNQPDWLQAIITFFENVWNAIKGFFGDVWSVVLLVIAVILVIVFFPYIIKFIVWLAKGL